MFLVFSIFSVQYPRRALEERRKMNLKERNRKEVCSEGEVVRGFFQDSMY